MSARLAGSKRAGGGSPHLPCSAQHFVSSSGAALILLLLNQPFHVVKTWVRCSPPGLRPPACLCAHRFHALMHAVLCRYTLAVGAGGVATALFVGGFVVKGLQDD